MAQRGNLELNRCRIEEGWEGIADTENKEDTWAAHMGRQGTEEGMEDNVALLQHLIEGTAVH